MFDLLLDPVRAEKKPWDLYFFALAFSIVALVLSNSLFDQYVGFGSAILLSFIFFPLLFKAFRHEEEVDAQATTGDAWVEEGEAGEGDKEECSDKEESTETEGATDKEESIDEEEWTGRAGY